MKPIFFRARYDDEKFVPSEPCDLPLGVALLVTVLSQTEAPLQVERRAKADLSSQNPARSYGPGAQEYDASMCIELNPDFLER
jgi:hypothetical protein